MSLQCLIWVNVSGTCYISGIPSSCNCLFSVYTFYPFSASALCGIQHAALDQGHDFIYTFICFSAADIAMFTVWIPSKLHTTCVMVQDFSMDYVHCYIVISSCLKLYLSNNVHFGYYLWHCPILIVTYMYIYSNQTTLKHELCTSSPGQLIICITLKYWPI